MRRVLSRVFVVVALAGVLGACRSKYAVYMPLTRDYQVAVPFAWGVVWEASGNDFTHANFIGPFDPRFFRGAPSFSVRWYRRAAGHQLADKSIEGYVSADDFIAQTLSRVYGPEYQLWSQPTPKEPEGVPCGRDASCIASVTPKLAGVESKLFLVVSADRIPPGRSHFGAAQDEKGDTINPRKHEYVVIPMDDGFYVLTYPATTAGYGKYKPQFNYLVNSFMPLKKGPGGADIVRGVSLPKAKS